MKRPRTPEELATKENVKAKYSLYLSVKHIDYLKERVKKSDGRGVSVLVDEAISFYIEHLKKDKSK